MTYTWAEPFAGAAAVALRLVGGPGLTPPVAWMGGKRRYARQIADAMGVPAGRPDRVLLADAGPWGWVWPLLLDPVSSRPVCSVLRSWQGEHPRGLWRLLASFPPHRDMHVRAAQWLWLQARSASGVPIWWDGWRHVDGRGRPASDRGEDLRWPAHRAERDRWSQADHATGRAQGATQTGGEGRPPQPAGQRGTWRFDARPCDAQESRLAGQCGAWRMGEEFKKAKRGDRTISQGGTARGRTGGMVNPATIAERVEAICTAFADVDGIVMALHGDAGDLPIGNAVAPSFCYLDPPYVGATGYGWSCPRAEVLSLAEAWAAAGAVVAVSEAEPLDMDGWHHLELTRQGGKPEWLTLSREPARTQAHQLELFEEKNGSRVGPVG